MDRTDAMAWVMSLCQDHLRKSQAKTLSVLVAAAVATMRLTLAGIGRQVAASTDAAAKGAIKRCWRFVANERVEPVEVMPAIMNHLWRRKLAWHARRPESRPLLVSLDWTKVRNFHVLMAAVVVEGRALPLCWESYRDRIQHKSQNALEEGMLARLQAALPDGVRILILADRGFGRAELIRTCQRLNLDYLIRVRGDVTVRVSGSRYYRGRLNNYAIRRGRCHSFTDAEYRSDGAVTTNLILRWKRGLWRDKDTPWYLVTNRPVGRGSAKQLSDLYALRFDIEELFRDAKNEHLGWSLGKTRVTRPDRLDRLILIAALAYVLLVALGLWCRANRPPRLWATNRRKRELSAWTIGRVMHTRETIPIADLITGLLAALATPEGKWG